MAVAIERYLKDFSQPDSFMLPADLAAEPQSDQLTMPEPDPVVAAAPEQPAVDIEAERAAAFEEGSRQVAEMLTATHQAELEAERSRHLDEINEMRTRFEQDFSTTLAARFDQLTKELSESIGEQVARVVAPFLERSLGEQMIEQLAAAIAQVLADQDGVRVAVSGSPSMFEALKTALGDRAAQLDYTEADSFDLTVQLEDTVLSTRLSQWADTLREILS